MNEMLDLIAEAATHCEEASRLFTTDPVATQIENLTNAIGSVRISWSGSWLGYHADLYLPGFRAPLQGEYFDPSWGPNARFASQGTSESWISYSYEEVQAEILRRTDVTSTAAIEQVSKHARDTFDQAREALLPTIDGLLHRDNDPNLVTLRKTIAELPSGMSRQRIAQTWVPRNFLTHDMMAVTQSQQGRDAPPHLAFEAWLLSMRSNAIQVAELAKLARRVQRYLQQRTILTGGTMTPTTGTVFIGHGGDPVWRELKDFLQNRLKLQPDEFNAIPTAGLTTTERLLEMLATACFAFLILTAEDEHADATLHARENIIHEVGLFQGHLGFRKAILLVEDGCALFSNIAGLTQIRFSKRNFKGAFEEIREVLEREGLLTHLGTAK